MTITPTLSSAIQSARGTCRAAPFVSSAAAAAGVEADEDPARDGERREHRRRLRAECHLRAGHLGHEREAVLPEDEQQRHADADRGDELGGDTPALIARRSTSTPQALISEQARTITAPATTIAAGDGADPDEGQGAHGAPR